MPEFTFTAPLTWSRNPTSPNEPWYQMGIYSITMGECGSRAIPDLFTRVTSLASWLPDAGIGKGIDKTGAIVSTFSNQCPAPLPPLTCNPSCGANAQCNKGTCQCLDGFHGDPIIGCGRSSNKCALHFLFNPLMVHQKFQRVHQSLLNVERGFLGRDTRDRTLNWMKLLVALKLPHTPFHGRCI